MRINPALALGLWLMMTPIATAEQRDEIRILTFNVWHGLRSGESRKTTGCGVHLGKILKIPKNMNEGLAILATVRLRRGE